MLQDIALSTQTAHALIKTDLQTSHQQILQRSVGPRDKGYYCSPNYLLLLENKICLYSVNMNRRSWDYVLKTITNTRKDLLKMQLGKFDYNLQFGVQFQHVQVEASGGFPAYLYKIINLF